MSQSPDFVILTGAFCAAEHAWQLQARLASLGIGVRIVDLPGREPNQSPSGVDLASCVANVCSELNRSTILIAHSLGAFVAEAVAREDERVRGIVYLAPAVQGTYMEQRPLRRLIGPDYCWPILSGGACTLGEADRAAYFGLPKGDVSLPASVRESGTLLWQYALAQYRERLPQCAGVATLVIAAELDGLFSLTEQHDLARHLGHEAGACVVYSATHMSLIAGSHARLAARDIRDWALEHEFLARTAQRSAPAAIAAQ